MLPTNMELIEVKPVRGLSAGEMAVLDAVNELLQEGIAKLTEAVKRAARKFMTLEESSREKLRAQSTKAGRDFVDALEKVAAHEMYPDLALETGWAAQHLKKLPIAEQEKWMKEGIPVFLEVKGNSKGDTIIRAPRDLSRDEISQVFETSRNPECPVRVLGVDEQRTNVAAARLVEERAARREKSTRMVVRAGRFKIEKSIFTPLKTRFTLRELEEILGEMRRLLG